MTLLAPSRLWLLVARASLSSPATSILQRRSRHKAVRHPDVALVASVAPRFAGWRTAPDRGARSSSLCVALVLGLARPAHSMQVPATRRSWSSPSISRLDERHRCRADPRCAPRSTAAKKYVAGARTAYRIGLVTFDAGPTRSPRRAPTTRHLLATLDSLNQRMLQHGTTAGEALYTALEVIRPSTARRSTDIARSRTVPCCCSLTAPATAAARSTARPGLRPPGVPVFTIAYGTAGGIVRTTARRSPCPPTHRRWRPWPKITGGVDYTANSAEQLAAV